MWAAPGAETWSDYLAPHGRFAWATRSLRLGDYGLDARRDMTEADLGLPLGQWDIDWLVSIYGKRQRFGYVA